MRNKISFLIVLLSLFIAPMYGQRTPSISCAQLPQLSSPKMAVNDFANILDDNIQAQIEAKLRTYFDTTSIAMVVATVPTLNENTPEEYALSLFRCWGIGDAKTNRGILILISMQPRHIEIMPGYGIESLLTDYECRHIAHEDMAPLCKVGNYAEGVQVGVDRIIEKLGKINWEERMAAIQNEKAKKARESKVFFFFALAVVSITGFLLLIGFIILLIVRWIKKIKLRNAVSKLISKTQTEIKSAEDTIKQAGNSFNSDPKWAQREANEHINLAGKNLAAATQLIDYAFLNLKKHPKEAQKQVANAHELIEKSYVSFQKANTNLRAKIQTVSQEAGKKLKEAEQQVVANLTVINDYGKLGYNVNQFVEIQNNLSGILSDYQAKLNNKEFHQEIYNGAKVIKDQSDKAKSSIETIVSQRTEIETQIEKLFASGKEVGKKAIDYIQMLDGYKRNFPPSVWNTISIDLVKKSSKLDLTALTTSVDKITDLNSMKVQDFATAYVRYQELQQLISATQSLFKLVDDTKSEQELSKKNYRSNYADAESLVSKALSVCRDSDVGPTAKGLSKKASQLLQEIAVESSHQLVDWVDITKTLATCVSTAKDAISKAKSNISDAETARENTRKAAIAAETARRESYVSSYNNDTSSSTSSGFGGFDGGSSGGGGGGSDF